jgi:hypothetical protein
MDCSELGIDVQQSIKANINVLEVYIDGLNRRLRRLAEAKELAPGCSVTEALRPAVLKLKESVSLVEDLLFP